MKGKFIVFEGIDGCGKSSISKIFYEYLKANSEKEPILTCEPYKQGLGIDIRAIMKKYDAKIDPVTDLLLFETARSEHVASIIMPSLYDGKDVICDRYTYSSCAYQGFAMDIPLDIIHNLNAAATRGLNPDIVFWIDADINKCMARNKKADSKDSMPYKYYEKCRDYYQFKADTDDSFIWIDGNGTIEEVTKRVIEAYEFAKKDL